VDYVPDAEEITADYAEGGIQQITLHDQSVVALRKPAPGWDPGDAQRTFALMHEARRNGEILTGLLYLHPSQEDLHAMIRTVPQPLSQLREADLCPGPAQLARINASFR
jgi:2-oxoglutarate ferredoxin oxidoreductase subunit beta